MIKSRHCAGDAELSSAVMDLGRRMTYGGPPTAEAIGEISHLKARMEKERIPRSVDPRRHIKLGPGGLSDIEFAVQLIQLAHGHDDESLRVTSTMAALVAARGAGLIGVEEALRLEETYSLLMGIRNRLFFQSGRPVDALPSKPEELEALGKAMGFTDQPRQELEETYLRATRRARRITEPLIYG